MCDREDFSTVGEWHGTLSWRVGGSEEENEQGDKTDAEGGMCLLVDEEAETGAEEEEEHERESAEKKSTTAPFVDGNEGWERKQEVGGTLYEKQ